MAATTASRCVDAAVATALLVGASTACESRQRPAPAASPSSPTAPSRTEGGGADEGASLAARKTLIDFIDGTARAAGGGLTFTVDDDARKPEDCHPDDTHNWTYSKFTSATGARAAKLMKDVEAHWKSQGRPVEHNLGALFSRFGDIKVVVGDVGANGAYGMEIAGSTSCFPGHWTDVPPPS